MNYDNANYYDNVDKNNEFIIFHNKIEELLSKLKFINNNFKHSIEIDEIDNNLFDILNKKNYNKYNITSMNEIINEVGISKTNIIDIIDDIIFKLNKKIIGTGLLKPKNNSIEFEF